VTWNNPQNNNQSQTDIYTADSTGNLWDYQDMPSGLLGPPTLAGTGDWNILTVFGVVDFNHDSYPDIVARDNTTCNENAYLGSATGFAATPIQFGTGWCPYTPFGIEDWYENGHFDVIARENATGKMWLYTGDLTSDPTGVNTRVQIGSGWTAGTYDPWGIIDFNGDGHTDIITRYEPTNILKLYPGDGNGGGYPSNGTQIGSGFNGDTIFGFVNYDNGTATEPDLIVRQAGTGNLQLFEGNGTGGWTDGSGNDHIATGW